MVRMGLQPKSTHLQRVVLINYVWGLKPKHELKVSEEIKRNKKRLMIQQKRINWNFTETII